MTEQQNLRKFALETSGASQTTSMVAGDTRKELSMLRTMVVRRVGRLLGAAAVTGVLLTSAPLAAQAQSAGQSWLVKGAASQQANSI